MAMDQDSMGHEAAGDRQRREEALRAIAGQRQPSAPAISPARPRGRSGGRRLILALLVVALLAAGGFGFWRASQPNAHPTTHHLPIHFPDGPLACVSDARWSPDGTRLAVLGHAGCLEQGNGTAYLGIYDSATGARLHLFDLMALAHTQAAPLILKPSAREDTTALASVGIDFSSLFGGGMLGWSPDGTQLAFQFGINAGQAPASAVQILGTLGVLLVSAENGEGRAVLLPQQDVSYSTRSLGSSFEPYQALRWDLTGATSAIVSQSPALGYAWDASGTLRPAPALPATAAAPAPAATLGPVGHPIGDPTFTMWQASTAHFATHFCSGPYFILATEATAWSPDGRYITHIQSVGRIPTAPTDDAPVNAPGCTPTSPQHSPPGGPERLAKLPMRDLGLRAALDVIQTAETAGEGAANLLSWDPTGRQLLFETLESGPVLTIYDCGSARVLKRINVATLDPQIDLSANVLARAEWSPDGTRLLLSDAHVLVVLSGAQLGG